MTLVGRLDLWLPPLALMGLIFFLSAQPDLSSGLGTWDLDPAQDRARERSTPLLFLLWWRALRDSAAPHAAALAAAWLIAVAYAATDEWHQTFVDRPPRVAASTC